MQKEFSNSYDVCSTEPAGVVDPEKLKNLGHMIDGAAATLAAIIELKSIDFSKIILS